MLESCFDHNNFPNIENRERKVLYSIDWGTIKFHNGKWQQMIFACIYTVFTELRYKVNTFF